jgi:redox-sensitive bicupin YhaK (pirin superfamily)
MANSEGILPVLPTVGPDVKRRHTLTIIPTQTMKEGAGFIVHRPFPGIDLHLADPFLLLDQMGPVLYEPLEAKGAPDHPHRGFETITYVLQGEVEHRDSTGGGGLIGPGDTQWMTAGGGIVHSEMPTNELFTKGGAMHGVQIWVNLPKSKKWATPKYQDITKQNVSQLLTTDGGVTLRLIAGEFAGVKGAGQTQTPIALIHATLQPDALLELEWPKTFNSLVYTLSGSVTVGSDEAPLPESQLAVLVDGDAISLRASKNQSADVLLLGGEPINEPIARYGPFVMNTREEIIQAIEDYESGRMGSIPPISA